MFSSSRSRILACALLVVLTAALVVAVPVLAKGKPTTELTNNQSFPVIAADGKSITALSAASWATAYAGPYDGLTAEELAIAMGDTWYAQKVTGNLWQGAFYVAPTTETVNVDGMDWGDNIESVSPTIGRPYRLETGLYALVAGRAFNAGTVDDDPANTDNAYGMVMLAYPSSPNEVQGTNATNTYWSDWATITSGLPGLRVQYIEGVTATLSWDATKNLWYYTDTAGNIVTPPNTGPAFAPELNVAGKYIYGASTGGWKPTALGKYRITFYIPATSTIDFVEGTQLGDLVGGVWVPQGTVVSEEGSVATPILDAGLNLTYVDVVVVSKGGK